MLKRKEDGRIVFNLRKDICLLIIAVLLLSWHPALLSSETIRLTSYYPAPYGGYDRLMTTGNTYLAKDGSFVNWGPTSSTKLSTSEGGGIELVGNSNSAIPFIAFRSSNTDYSLDPDMTLSLQYRNGERILSASKDFMIGTSNELTPITNTLSLGRIGIRITKYRGSLRRICTIKPYENGKKTYCGNSKAESSKYLIVGLENKTTVDKVSIFPNFPIVLQMDLGGFHFVPKSGNMICCKFEAVS